MVRLLVVGRELGCYLVGKNRRGGRVTCLFGVALRWSEGEECLKGRADEFGWLVQLTCAVLRAKVFCAMPKEWMRLSTPNFEDDKWIALGS